MELHAQIACLQRVRPTVAVTDTEYDEASTVYREAEASDG